MEPASTALTFYDDMALVRRLDAVVAGVVGYRYERARDTVLRAISDLDRERDPCGIRTTCPMCGSALVPLPGGDASNHAAKQGAPHHGGIGLSNTGIGAIVGALGGAIVGGVVAHRLEKRARRTLSDKLIALLRAQPGRPINELAAALYGEDSQNNRAKVRALLAQLGKAGRLRNVHAGHWEAVDDQADDNEEVSG